LSLAALPTKDDFSQSSKVNFVQNVEAAKEKLLSKDYQGVINLLSINIKSKNIPNSYLVESLINRANAYFSINNYKNAKADYLKCLDIELCQRADVNLILGKLEVMLGNNEIAASYFKNAILLSKNNFKVLSEALSFFKNP
jgi:tetratricopeptide (TPR) repeat protein